MLNGNRIKLYENSLYMILIYYNKKKIYYIMLFSIESIFVVSIFLIINVLYTYYHVPLFFHFCIIFAQSKRHFFFKISNYIRLYSSFFFFFFWRNKTSNAFIIVSANWLCQPKQWKRKVVEHPPSTLYSR